MQKLQFYLHFLFGFLRRRLQVQLQTSFNIPRLILTGAAIPVTSIPMLTSAVNKLKSITWPPGSPIGLSNRSFKTAGGWERKYQHPYLVMELRL